MFFAVFVFFVFFVFFVLAKRCLWRGHAGKLSRPEHSPAWVPAFAGMSG